uniref:Reverse transcriptase domain-containing protein n=1 Tax=Acrobeloides nanus TaxID=290746 RepID=A0A914D4P1_9BILA
METWNCPICTEPCLEDFGQPSVGLINARNVCQKIKKDATSLLQCLSCSNRTHPKCAEILESEFSQVHAKKRVYNCSTCELYAAHLTMPLLKMVDYFEPPRERPPNAAIRTRLYEKEVESLKPIRTRKLTISCANVNSLCSKLDELRVICSVEDPDVFLLQETKRHENISDEELQIPGYNLFRLDRTANGGGVAIYAKQELKPCHQKLIQVVSIYRAPSKTQAHFSPFYDYLGDFLATTDSDSVPMIIGGDINLDWLSKESDDLKNLLENYKLSQVVKEKIHKERLIDHLYVSENTQSGPTEYKPPVENHHHRLNLTLNLQKPRLKEDAIEMLNYRRANWKSIKEALTKTHLCQTVAQAETVDEAWAFWHSKVTEITNQYIPKKKLRLKRKTQWITPEVKRMSKAKDLAYQAMRRNETPENVAAFKRIRRNLKKLNLKKKTDYIHRTITDANNPAEFWINIKSLTGKNIRAAIPDLQDDGKEAKSNEEKAEVLAKSFKKISEMPNRSAAGKDGLTMTMLKNLKEELAASIAMLVNRSILEGTFPCGWKDALVVPIPKARNSSNPGDYRPISLLPIVSKIAEKHLYYSLYSTIEKGLSDNQFGFRRLRSTTEALLYFEHLVMSGFQESKKGKNVATKVAAVFFDIKKAFDTVPHADLLEKLTELRLPKNWFALLHSYLKSRTFTVRVGNAESSKEEVTSGVPQGSVLGPFLFLYYVDQIFSTKLSRNAKLVMYADDLAYVKPIPTEEDAKEMQEDMETLHANYCYIKLELNAKKTKCMLLSAASITEDLKLSINGEPIEQVDCFRYLGIDL